MPEQLTEDELISRATAVIATVAEERTEDVDALLADLTPRDVAVVVYAVGNVAVETLALLYGHDVESPEGRAAVAEQARRLAVRVMADDG
ncbi:hypothetical protein [Streptomyces sp. NRRL F-5527]|uniref:hypothetical protein n=1 Tax=Streptomyces TaxID=1883 RepID=UPI0004C9D66F|nr:hypothetical protein [Streptomyces sp. NRRL F-5527]